MRKQSITLMKIKGSCTLNPKDLNKIKGGSSASRGANKIDIIITDDLG